MENQFDLGLNIASIETELPDPVITLSGSDVLTALGTAKMPLINLTAYGRSTQGYASHGGKPLGKNLFDFTAWKNGIDGIANGTAEYTENSITLNATNNNCYVYGKSSAVGSNYKWSLKPNTTYTLSWTANNNNNGQIIVFFNGDETDLVYRHNDYFKSFAFTTKTDTAFITVRLGVANAGESITYSNIQLEEGSVVTDYEPYYSNPNPDCPVPIESIGDGGSMTVMTYGKNLMQYIDISTGYGGITFALNSDNSITANGTATRLVNSSAMSKQLILPNGDYIVSGCAEGGSASTYKLTLRMYKTDGTSNYISITKETKVTIDKNITKVLLYCELYEGITANNLVFKPMIRCADVTDNTYEPYKGSTATITTGLALKGIPVSSDGNHTDSNGQDWICDTLEHVYGEPAQVVKRVKNASVRALYEMKEGSTAYIKDHSGNGHNLYVWIKNAQFVWRDDISDPCWYLSGDGVWHRYVRDELGEYKLLYDEAWTDSYFNEYGASIRIVAGTWTVRQITYKGLPLPEPLPALPVTVPAFSLSTGDPVPSVYISDVGGISDGAEIIYPSEAEEIILTTHETEGLNKLSGYEGTTTVYNENAAEMTVKLLREDYEMQYIHWIKESQSFVCEKTGKYKIICVGGGSSGGVGARGAADTLQAVGTTTSFGNIISASGGGKTKPAAEETFSFNDIVGGQSGYDGINYGSTAHVMSRTASSVVGDKSSVMWGTGHGYGAGGGAKGCRASYTTADEGQTLDFVAAGGQCGRVESTIVDLEENQTVFCTVGGGGVLNLSDQNVVDYLKNHVTDTATGAAATGSVLSACVTDGADGVIIIQYLGL